VETWAFAWIEGMPGRARDGVKPVIADVGRRLRVGGSVGLLSEVRWRGERNPVARGHAGTRIAGLRLRRRGQGGKEGGRKEAEKQFRRPEGRAIGDSWRKNPDRGWMRARCVSGRASEGGPDSGAAWRVVRGPGTRR